MEIVQVSIIHQMIETRADIGYWFFLERDTDWLYFPIACSPYMLFPGEKKPL